LTNWILRWVISGIALAVVAHLNIGVSYDDVTSLAIATVVIGLVNSLIRPILVFLTLPLNCMTFGLFSVILNAILFSAAGNAVSGFHVKWPWGAILGPILMGLFTGLLNNIIPDGKKD
jgi:putative membrane protein